MQPKKKYSAIAFDLHDVLFMRNYKKMLYLMLTTPGKLKIIITLFNPRFLYDVLCLYRKTRVAEEYILTLGAKYPLLKPHIDRGIAITNSLLPCNELFHITQQLKEHGYSLYIFSNIGKKTYHELLKIHAPLFTLFDGIHYTHENNNWLQKPLPNAYHHFIKRFNLKPSEVVFIDDSKKNSNAAQSCGITAIHYKSVDQLRNSFLHLGILPT
jgi:FMN phosphatase YigB (HAD superfamily)